MYFRPSRRLGLGLGLVVTLLSLGLAVALLLRLVQTPPTLASLIAGIALIALLIISVFFGYWSYGCFALRYHLDNEQLSITWGFSHHSIPLSNIQRIMSGLETGAPRRIRGVNWPGYHVGRTDSQPLGRTLFFSTHRRAMDLIYLVTPEVTFALSPADKEDFILQLSQAQLGLTQMTLEGISTQAWQGRSLFLNPTTVTVAIIGLLLNAGLFAYVLLQYPSLPVIIPLHYTPAGQIDQVGMREAILWLPGGGLAVLLLNLIVASLLHQRERALALASLGAVIAVQVLVWVSAISIIS